MTSLPTPRRRILSIDGGGIKGSFPAAFLAAIEESLDGKSVAEYFDLIVGTSTGGIIALGLGLGYSATQITQFYREHGPMIFPRETWTQVKLLPRQLISSKYTHEQLRNAVEHLLGTKKLGDSTRRLMIPCFNVEAGEIYVFKTRHHDGLERDNVVPAVDVALAAASAPTFYPAYRLNDEIPLVDGAVWANNPVAIAVVEAIGVLKWPAESIQVLSIGCTKKPYAANWARNKSLGVAYWAWNGPDLFMASQSSAADNMVATLLGPGNVQRINPLVPSNRYGLDKSTEIESLCGLGKSEARKQFPLLEELFFDVPAEPFVPEE